MGNNSTIKSFKDRVIDETQPILLYRNLSKKGRVYSLKQNGLVVAHTTAICLKNVDFIVNKAGKRVAINSKIRNVHAFVKGYITYKDIVRTTNKNILPVVVKYDPFCELGFYIEKKLSKREIKTAKFIIANERGITATHIR